MSIRVKVEGMKALQDSLQELGKATGRNVMRRVLTARLEPVAEEAMALAPVKTGTARDSVEVSTRLGRKARRGHSKMSAFAVEAYVGPTEGVFYTTMLEFGTSRQAPVPFMRPAWDKVSETILDDLAKDIGEEIEAAIARKGRKAAKAAAASGGDGE